jgi:hypothetical protein
MNIIRIGTALLLLTVLGTFAQVPKYDYGPSVHVPGRKATGKAFPVKLGDSGFQANYVVSHYTDEDDSNPDFVTISVEQINSKGSTVFFERQFPADEVSKDLLNSQTKDVVSYNDHLKTVYFEIDGKVFRYPIPRTKE